MEKVIQDHLYELRGTILVIVQGSRVANSCRFQEEGEVVNHSQREDSRLFRAMRGSRDMTRLVLKACHPRIRVLDETFVILPSPGRDSTGESKRAGTSTGGPIPATSGGKQQIPRAKSVQP